MARTIRWRRPRRSVTSWCITSARIIGHQQALAGDLLLLLHLHDVMNLGIIKHIEAVKHWNALTISTAYHIPVFIEKHSNWSDTSWCNQPLWSPPSNWSVNNFHVNHHNLNHSISDPSWRKFQRMWYILMSATSLVDVIVFLADCSAIHHQPTYTLCGQTCRKYKQLSFKSPSPQHITS